jgi:flagellar motor protein MotB
VRARRANPWPAVTDLFAALMITALAAYAVTSTELATEQARGIQNADVLKETQRISAALRASLVERNAPKGWEADVENCGFDTCVPVKIEFALSKAELLPEGQERVRELCAAYAETVKRVSDTKEVVLVIEGHTDPSKPATLQPEDRDRFNWDLSGRRATSVLRAFDACGVTAAAGFEVHSAGYADTRPVKKLPGEGDASWNNRRRRTTMRIRINQDEVRTRLQPRTATPPAAKPPKATGG